MRSKFNIRFATFLLGACLAAGHAVAEKPDKGDKHRDKHEKVQEKARKHGDKADKHAGKSHAKEVRQGRSGEGAQRIGGYFDEQHRSLARSHYREHYGESRGCPPGLAKKNNGCMPPGQAKKYRMGQPLPRDVVYYPVPQPVLVQLPSTPPGYRYVRVGNDILLLSPQSALVVDAIVNIFGGPG